MKKKVKDETGSIFGEEQNMKKTSVVPVVNNCLNKEEKVENLIKNRYEFELIYDVVYGNPNGDPDADNSPRQNPYTGKGEVTDGCIKRKVRNYVESVLGEPIFYKLGYNLNYVLKQIQEECIQEGLINRENGGVNKKRKDIAICQKKLLEKYFDVRAFGAVATTGPNCGQITGPISINTVSSVDPISPFCHTITRTCKTDSKNKTTLEDYEKDHNESKQDEFRTMGRKHMLDYAAYVVRGSISPFLAEQTSFTEKDLEIFWDALANMFEHSRTASSGICSSKKLIIFKHVGTASDLADRQREAKKGCCHSHKLFGSIKISRKNGVERAQSFDDYDVIIPTQAEMPRGIEIVDYIK